MAKGNLFSGMGSLGSFGIRSPKEREREGEREREREREKTMEFSLGFVYSRECQKKRVTEIARKL